MENNNTHVLILEDHRWERGMVDFDPKKDIGDWLIFSMTTDDERDWFGRFVETQYPLTYAEYKSIEKVIHEVEIDWRQNKRGGSMNELIDKIELILILEGQHDLRFPLGSIIRYDPHEVKTILLKHREELKQIITG